MQVTSWQYEGQWESNRRDIVLMIRADNTFVLKNRGVIKGTIDFTDEDSIIVADVLTVDEHGLQNSGQFFLWPEEKKNTMSFATRRYDRYGPWTLLVRKYDSIEDPNNSWW